eukprot:Phypoly_transcript_16796.p1 GENE.Phypoly_transcript_16796~~Phypoly_transcript_16796.p1  ORF type:complete len:114 (+),score=14.17 Phypoly_transcript_16796:441-782(+)
MWKLQDPDRFFMSYTEFLDNSVESNPFQIFERFLDALMGYKMGWAIGVHIQTAVAQFPTPELAYKELRDLSTAYAKFLFCERYLVKTLRNLENFENNEAQNFSPQLLRKKKIK